MAREAEMSSGRRGSGWRVFGWGAAVALLMLPFVAMRLSDEVNWTASDFVFAGVMIGGVGLAFELAVRQSRGNTAYTMAAGVALAAAFLLVWINAAVGIIGGEDEALNLLYGGVLALALAGAIVARFEPAGMVRAMTVAAAAQASIGVVALVAGWGAMEPPGPLGILILNAFFAALLLGSAWLFRKVARQQIAAGPTP